MAYILLIFCLVCIGLGFWLVFKKEEIDNEDQDEKQTNVIKGVILILFGILGGILNIYLIQRLGEDSANFAIYNQETINFISDTLKLK